MITDTTVTKGHRPARLTFHERLAQTKVLQLRTPPKLPLEAPFGPRPQGPDWSEASEAASAALLAARTGTEEAGLEAPNGAYRAWCQAAECSLVSATGAEPKLYGVRGRHPQLKWKSALPEDGRRRPGRVTFAAPWQWLRSLFGTLTDLCAQAAADLAGF